MKNLSESTISTLFEAMLEGSEVATVVTDPQLKDNPIIYTNRTFEKLTGYSREEIEGKNCRFLQGDGTNPGQVKKVREAIENEKSVTVVLKNFRKDGSSFWNRLHIAPVRVEDQLFFIGTQTNVSVEEEQRVLLTEKEEEISRLMLPILPVDENLAAVSLVGRMDNDRFSILTTKLSEYVKQSATMHIIIDISGIIWEDHFPAQQLMIIQDVLRLMGSHLYVTGINPKMAIEITGAGNDGFLTFSTVQQAIAHAQTVKVQ